MSGTTRTIPTFKKHKFSSPVVTKKDNESKGSSTRKEEFSDKTSKKGEFVTIEEENVNTRKKKHSKKGRKKSEDLKDKDLRNKTELNGDASKELSLSDSQYNEIFARVLAGEFLELDERFAGSQDALESEFNENTTESGDNKENVTAKMKANKRNGKDTKRFSTDKGKKKQRTPDSTVERTFSGEKVAKRSDELKVDCRDVTPAENFTESISQKSPNITKRTNEVTPVVSPQDQAEYSVLAKKPKLKQKQKKPKANEVTKRKSLEYAKVDEPKVEHSEQRSPRSKENEQEEGTWVQCTSCDKWRFLSECLDPAALPEDWNCTLNPNKGFSSCSNPEEEWETFSQEFVYSKFTPGSIVWAKMAGYPAWPAMVDCEPDFDTFCETFADNSVSHYHVVFLDDHVSRAWISHKHIEVYRADETPVKLPRDSRKGDFARDLDAAKKRAQQALKMTILERQNNFSFQNRYHGKSRWSRDKHSMEKKLKQKSREKSENSKGKRDRAEHKKEYKTPSEAKSMTSTPCKEKFFPDKLRSTEKLEKKDSSHVSASEDEVSACMEKGNLESVFMNVEVNENHDRSEEIPFVQTVNCTEGMDNDSFEKPLQIDSDVFTMELGKHQEEEYQSSDLKQKMANDTETEPSESNGKTSLRRVSSSGDQDEFWLASENPTSVPVESLFEDMLVADGALQEPSEVQWEEFSEMMT